ncbi:MAG TPA: hypothetical protein VGC55_09905 [Dokdonella sp.]
MRTSLYSILCIVIRLGAIMLFVDTLTSLPFAFAGLQGDASGPGASGILIGISSALVALAALLWVYPGLLARLAVSRSSQQTFESPIEPVQLQTIAFAVLGVAFAMYALLDLTGVVLRLGVDSQVTRIDFGTLLRQDGVALGVQILKLAFGIRLALGARGLAGFLERLRERGLPPAFPASDAQEKRSHAE